MDLMNRSLLLWFHFEAFRNWFCTPGERGSVILRLLGTFVLVSVLMPHQAQGDDAKTNIIFFLADDLGWTGLKSFGSDFYETPCLDQLADSGMRFTNAYAACTVCSPTRASIMTGMYPARLHLTDFIAGQNRPFAKMKIPDWTKQLEQSTVTIAEKLREHGYRTGLVGKWHLSPQGGGLEDSTPYDHGFDFVIDKPKGTKGYQLSPDKVSEVERRTYLTDYLTDEAIRFIEKESVNPFFLYFAYHVPHTPIQGRKDLVEYFEKKRDPNAIHQNANYAAMVASMDQSVGRILERLEQLGLSENTLVVFTSDNGGLTQRYGKHDGFTENLPLRRGKGSAYEGGVRVPTIIRWPGETDPGSMSEEPICSIDYFPTLIQIARGSLTEVDPSLSDGVSLVPILQDSKQSLERDLFWHYPHYHAGGDGPYSAVRSGRWRLIEFHESAKVELYDLVTDIGEQNNLLPVAKDRAEMLLRKLRAWQKEVGAQFAVENPAYQPAKAMEVRKR